jgi:hypothetical protein
VARGDGSPQEDAQVMSNRSRPEKIAALKAVLGQQRVFIMVDGVVEMAPIEMILAPFDDQALDELFSALRKSFTFLAGHGWRLETQAFRRFCSQPLIDVIDQMENIVADRLADVGEAGVDFVLDQVADDEPHSDGVILAKLLRQPYREARQHEKRAFKIIGSLLHDCAPLWVLSLFSGRRAS